MKLLALAAAMVLLATACDRVPLLGSTTDVRTVLVDFSHDEYASYFLKNFPQRLTITQGTEVLFRQTWTGEPHSVTGGTLVNDLMEKVEPFIEKVEKGEEIPAEPPEDIAKLEQKIPRAFGDEGELNQTAAQPCYLDEGRPSTDGKPCRVQEQPDFAGNHTFYNSGVIPFEGQGGNEYSVKFADDIKPGDYWFLCHVHGPFQSTKVTVKPAGAEVPSQEDVSRQARKEIDALADPLLKTYRKAARDGRVRVKDTGTTLDIRGRFAGLFDPNVGLAAVNEFIPRRIRVDEGDPIKWNLIGRHSISFDVPRYFPIIQFLEDGTVRYNPRIEPPFGGAKKFDVPDEKRYSGGPDPISFDGGTYDGRGFWSSGTIDAEPYIEYTMRITRPGTYEYACLVHPPMVGTIVVR